jgi:hypothetical protein
MWAQCRFHKKCAGSCDAEVVFLVLVGSVGNVVHSGTFRGETSTHYFSCSCGPGAVSIKSTGKRYAKLVFLHLM